MIGIKKGNDAGGGPAQPWLQRYAELRQDRNLWRYVAFGLLTVALLTAGWAIYESRAPKYVLAPFKESRNGQYMPMEEHSVPDEPGKKYLLGQWMAAWRIGCQDDNVQCKQQVTALVLNTTGNVLLTQVQEYVHSVAGKKVTVTMHPYPVQGSGFDYIVDWDESVGGRPPVPMRAYVTIAFGDRFVEFQNSSWMNPYGMFISQPIRIVQAGE
jgi:type IV secretory pathway TrbF-like protein